MRTWTIIVAALALATGVAAVAVTAVAEEPEGDAIRILWVGPEEPVERGVETTFTVDVEARLESTDEGLALVSFNVEKPTWFKTLDSRIVRTGFQQLTFEVKVVPVDWGDRGQFTVMVTLEPRREEKNRTPTASDRRTIEVTP